MSLELMKQIHARKAQIGASIAELRREDAALSAAIAKALGVGVGSVVEDARGSFQVLAAEGGFELLDSSVDGCYLAVPAVFCEVRPANKDGSFDARVKRRSFTHLATALRFNAKQGQAVE